MDDAKTNKRNGIVVPRSVLLPPYMISNPYFTELTDAMDAVYGPNVDDKINVVANLRNMWVQNPTTETTIQAHQLIDDSEWSHPDRDILVKQTNFLGMKLAQAGVVTNDAYQSIARYVGQYWFGKGTQAFIEFINFCLSGDLRVANLWTQDYQKFYREGNVHIGTPIWQGGTWYPTTHVDIVAKGGLGPIDIFTLQSFFYEIANFNLVLNSIDQNFDLHIVDRIEPGHLEAQVMAIGAYMDINIAISNVKSFGADPPPTQELPNGEFPTTYYAMGSTPADFNTAFLLGQPIGWTKLDGGQLVPVYGAHDQLITDEADIGTQMLGYTQPSGEFDLLYGPVTWVKIPGSEFSLARLPAFSTDQSTIIDGISVSARAVGAHRNKFLVNPKGFFQLYPGQFVPYW